MAIGEMVPIPLYNVIKEIVLKRHNDLHPIITSLSM